MIIYHCTRDCALFLSYLLLCHPYIPFHLIEMIFILVPPVFLLKVLCMCDTYAYFLMYILYLIYWYFPHVLVNDIIVALCIFYIAAT